jgi:hypothetical protein
MNNGDDGFDAAELASAETLEIAVDAALVSGRSDDPVIAGLVKTFAVRTPARLDEQVRRRVEAERDRQGPAWVPARLAAAVLAAFLFVSGITPIFFGHWLARAVNNQYAPHIYREGGLAFLAVSGVVAWAALRPRWLDLAVMVGSPLGVLLAINGAAEITHLRTGALDHVPQLLTALALAYFWWQAKNRYRHHRSGEDEV